MIKLNDNDLGKIATWRAKEWSKKQTYLSFEDLLSVSYMAITKALKKFDENRGTKITTYMTICVDNAIKTAITKEAKQHNLKAIAEAQFTARQEQEQEAQAVRDAIVSCLNEEEQEIVHLYFYDRKTLSEIAKIFNTNHVQIHRKIEKIKQKLKEGLTQ